MIDGIVPEPEGGAQADPDAAARLLGEALRDALDDLVDVPGDELRRRRRAQVPLARRLRLSFRSFGKIRAGA